MKDTDDRNISLSVRLAFVYAAAAFMFMLFLVLSRMSFAAASDALGDHMYYKVLKGETLYDIAQKFDVGIGEIRSANPTVTDATLKAGKILTLPTSHLLPDVAHEGIVINLPERRLYYFRDEDQVMSFPVTVGKEGWETPMGVTYIANKRENPTWTVPDNIKAEDPTLPDVVPPGPDNPLGKYAMDLGFNGIRIHGTNNPRSIGKQSSHGCIRMYPADIEKLFNMAPLKTKVTIINQPYKVGWRGNTLLLEVAPPAAGTVARSVSVQNVKDGLIRKVDGSARIDWDTVDMTVKRRDGVPVAIGRRANGEQPQISETVPIVPRAATTATAAAPARTVTTTASETAAQQGYVARVQRPPVQSVRRAYRLVVPDAYTPYTARTYRPAQPSGYEYPSTTVYYEDMEDARRTRYYENEDGYPLPPIE